MLRVFLCEEQSLGEREEGRWQPQSTTLCVYMWFKS